MSLFLLHSEAAGGPGKVEGEKGEGGAVRPRPLHKVARRQTFLVIVVIRLLHVKSDVGSKETMRLEGVVGEDEHAVTACASEFAGAAHDLEHGGDGVVRIGVGEIVGCTMDGIWDYLHLTVVAAEDFAVGRRQG